MRLAPLEALPIPACAPREERGPRGLQNLLVERALGGGVQATHELLHHVAADVRRTVKRILRSNHPDLEDTIQDALLSFARALPGFRFESNIVHYAVRIAFRTAISAKKRARTWRERFLLTSEVEQNADDSRRSPSQEAIAEQQRRALDRALAKLPQLQSEVLVLWMVLEYSISEIAEICEASPNTVKSRLRLGREALRYYIERDAVLRSASGGPS